MPTVNKSHAHSAAPLQQQRGYILIYVLILLAGLLAVSLQFLDRSVVTMKLADYSRSSNESLLMAESALNWLYGSYNNGGRYDGKELDRDSLDIDTDNPNFESHPYIFFIRENNRLRSGVPDILQRMADGEARHRGGRIDKQGVDAGANHLLIADMLNAGQPMRFEKTDAFRVAPALDWDKSANARALAWIEAVRDPSQPSRVLFYAQAVGQYDSSRSYVQRYLGSYSDTLGTDVSVLSEGSNGNGELKAEKE